MFTRQVLQRIFYLIIICGCVMFGSVKCGSDDSGSDGTDEQGLEEPEPEEPNTVDYIIADHTIVDLYDDIPQEYINIVKTMWVSVPGESHSVAYRTGLQRLETLDSGFAVEIQTDGVPSAVTDQYLRFSNHFRLSNQTWIYSTGEHRFWTTGLDNGKEMLDYCNTTGPKLTAMGLGWCWDFCRGTPGPVLDPVYRVNWYGSTDGGSGGFWGLDADDSVINCQTYIDAVVAYNEHDPDVVTFFTTGPVEGSYSDNMAGYQGWLKHEAIRRHVKENGGVLFDYADILCYNDSNEKSEASWTDDLGTVHTFIIGHRENVGVEETGHISFDGSLRLGKAMWWMLARIAGWDGN